MSARTLKVKLARDNGAARKLAGLFAFASAVVCVYAMRQADPDFFGYLTYGRLFVQEGGPTSVDPFAYTSEGLHWVTFEYLSQILLWATYQHFGPLGLIGLKCLLGGGAIYFLFAAVRTTTDDPYVWVPAFLLCTVTLSRYFVFRPQLFTFVFFALFVTVVFRFLVKGKASLWLLPLVMIVWTNTHGGFLAGLGALGLAVLVVLCQQVNSAPFTLRGALGSAGPLALALLACIAATFINPQGARLWRYVVTEILHDTNRRYIAEWSPVSWQRDAWSATAIVIITAALIGVGWLAHQRRRSVAGLYAWQWLAICAPVVAIAYFTARNVTIAAIWSAPVLTLLASSVDRSSTHFRRLWLVVGASALVGVFLTFAYVWQRPRPEIATGGALLGTTHPCRAVAFMRRNRLSGKLYNPLWWGSYITWELYPAIRVSMDGRNISLFPDEMVTENLRFYSGEASRGDLEAPFRDNADYLLVPSDLPILQLILADARWQTMYAEGNASLFVRADLDHQSILLAIGRQSLVRQTEDCPFILGQPSERRTGFPLTRSPAKKP